MLIEISRPDGGVSILEVKGGAENVQKAVDKWSAVRGAALSHREIAATDIPDRTFRDAWVPGLAVDMPKARTIHMDRIRAKRNKELDRLDKEHTKESGRGRKVQADAIEAKRETLRNIPATFDLSGASTPEELAALWPADVPK